MKSLNLRSSITVLLFGVLVSVAQAADIWTSDLAAAQKKAAAEKKDIIILFTGSTWCPYCIKLHDKVLSQSEFETEAPKDFVLVKIDFPKDLRTTSKESMALAHSYNVQGFPTVILADESGKTYARTEYFKGVNASVYLGHLKVLKDEAATVQQKITDGDMASDPMDKARKYHEAIEMAVGNGAPESSFRAQIKYIAVTDKSDSIKYQGSAPYRMVYVGLVVEEVQNLLRAGELSKAHAATDLLLAEIPLKTDEKQGVLFGIKGRLYEAAGDAKKAIETYRDAIALDPKSKLVPAIEEHIQELEKALKSAIIDAD